MFVGLFASLHQIVVTVAGDVGPNNESADGYPTALVPMLNEGDDFIAQPQPWDQLPPTKVEAGQTMREQILSSPLYDYGR